MEFVGYEKEDAKAVADIDKAEVEAYKTLNEKRKEKGLKKIKAEWADIPLNPQAVQMFQAAQMNQDQGEGGGADDESWGDYQGALMGEDAEGGDFGAEPETAETPETEAETTEETTPEDNGEMNKSLLQQTKEALVFKI